MTLSRKELDSVADRGKRLTKVERSLQEIGIETFVPRMLREFIHKRNKRIILREFAVMPGYVFFRVHNVEQLSRALASSSISAALGPDGHPFFINPDTVFDLQYREMTMDFDDTRVARIRRKEEGRAWRTKQLQKYPPGCTVYLKDEDGAPSGWGEMKVIGPSRRGYIKLHKPGTIAVIDVPLDWIGGVVEVT